MTMPLALVAVMVVLYAGGVYLLLDRSLTRVLLGFLLVGNATNLLLFLTSGSFGAAPLYGTAEPEEMSDPLPQAFILTSIVITFGVSAFILALIYRAWRLARSSEDAVQDDEQDAALTAAESLTTEEVTDEELASTPEFPDDSDDDDSDDDSADGAGEPGPAGGVGEGARS
ncbi:Na(+)/H(+) antiporter subunit C [Leucobacter weissii]|uniref:Na(+)/H(+) antiporter subunit C n=1 Tax=Leucobacter weissii TaxID=1983706 RepID=A0A939SC27_9MICO|nr:Na(+)/H(+) antiporter subunit C [Leucobacter weissii]MBO1902035.1 Na(+)/H(+) antiporter subunit C [Leucobacter weissii]